MTNIISKLIFCLLFIFSVSCSNEESSNDKVIVSIIKERNSRNFNSIEKGLLDQIRFSDLDIQINFYTSDGDDVSTIEIANKVRDDNSTIAIVIGENATLVSMNVIVPQSIIFAGCFDYVSMESIRKSKIQNNNITGVYGVLDITKYLDMISSRRIHNLAYLYSKYSRISSHVSEELVDYCIEKGINYYPLTAEDDYEIDDIERIITSKNIDYLYLSKDKYINDNIYNIDFICDKYSIPIINTDLESALNIDILFSLDFNYYYLGRQLALLLIRVINNEENTDGIDFVKLDDSYHILLNEDVASSCSISFTEYILDSSSIIISNGNILRR